MPRKSTKSTKRTAPTKNDKTAEQAKPPKPIVPTKLIKPTTPRRQTEEVIAAIYYFGAFGLSGNTISKLILSKYPRAWNVRAEDCHDRLVWFRDHLASKELPFKKTSVGKPVKDAVPFIADVNYITEVDDQCEKILQRHPSSLVKKLKDQNNKVRAAIMNEFSAEEHSEYEMWKKTAESMFRSRPLPQDNPLPPGALAHEGYNEFLGHWTCEY